ncbi:MAG: hypothetical protein JSR34_05615 [Proteobacteria bacterium]|nr:hypothetical protein [Pseudomonadota bacterium]
MHAPRAYLDYIDGAFERMAHGRFQVDLTPKQVLTDRHGDGDFRVMPCVSEADGVVCKTVKIVGTNLRRRTVPDQITVGRAFVMDAHENFISHTVDACLLSSARTGACAVTAIRRLRPCTEILALFGCGKVGFYTAVFALAGLGVRRLLLADTRPELAHALAAHLSQWNPEVSIEAVATDSALAAPVLVLATTSRTPVVAPGDTAAGLVVSLGADADDQSELDPGWACAPDTTIYADTLDCLRFGDVRAWIASGMLPAERIRELLDAYRQPPSLSGRTVFVSTGSALFDNLTLRYLLLHPG